MDLNAIRNSLLKRVQDVGNSFVQNTHQYGNYLQQNAQNVGNLVQQGTNTIAHNIPQTNVVPVPGLGMLSPFLHAPKVNITPFLQTGIQSAGNAIGQAIPAVNRLQTAPLSNPYKNPFDPIKDFGKGVKAAGYVANPLQTTIGGLFSAGMQAGFNVYNKNPLSQDLPQAFGQGLDFGATLAPIGGFVSGVANPLIQKGVNLLPGKNVPAQIGKNLLSGVLKESTTGGAYGAVTGQNPLISALTFAPYGVTHGLKLDNIKANLKGVNPQAFDLHPQDAEELAQIGQFLLKAKPGEILPKQQNATLVRTFERLFPGYNIDKMSNKQIASVIGATLDRYNGLKGSNASQFPSMGLVDNNPLAGEANVAQQGGNSLLDANGKINADLKDAYRNFIPSTTQDKKLLDRMYTVVSKNYYGGQMKTSDIRTLDEFSKKVGLKQGSEAVKNISNFTNPTTKTLSGKGIVTETTTHNKIIPGFREITSPYSGEKMQVPDNPEAFAKLGLDYNKYVAQQPFEDIGKGLDIKASENPDSVGAFVTNISHPFDSIQEKLDALARGKGKPGFTLDRFKQFYNPTEEQITRGKVYGINVPTAEEAFKKLSSPQQPLGGVNAVSTVHTNPTEQQISPKTPVIEGAGAIGVKPLQLNSGEPPQIPKNPENGVQSASDSIISKVKDKVNKFYTQSMDRFHPLSSLAHQAGEDRAMRNALTGYYGSGSTAQYHIDYELSPILKSVDVNELRKASIALRDAELQGRGIKGSNTGALGELLGKQGQGLKDPKMGEALQKLYKYQDNLVQEYLVKTGIMSPESYAAMKKNNQFYVPFKRVMDQVDEYLGGTPQSKGAGSVSGQNVIKGIKGSDKAIHDPLESIVENTYKLVGLGKRQEVAKTIVGLKDKLPEGVISKISGKLPLNKNNVVALFENGKVEHYKVPTEVADAAKGMSEEQMNMIVKVLAAPTRVFRATATGMNPEFAIPNVVRDVQSAFVNVGVNPLKWVSGLAHMIKQDEVYQEFLKSGGLTSRISLDRPYLKKTVADISGTPKQALRLTDPRRIKGILEALGQYSEQPTRIASFEKALGDSLKKGLPREEALKDAAYAAQEGTVNFARRGSKTQGLNAIYAFLNARAQGTDRIIRSIKADPKGASVRLGLISAAPAIATYAWNRNFSSYNDKNVVPDYVKQNNFVIMLSNTPIPQLGGAQYIAIPKGDVGKLANPIESFLSYADGKGGDVRGSLASTLGAFSPFSNIGDIIPTAIRPITENAANYNFFYGRPIVADSKKNYPAPYQTSKSTPAIYNQVGQFLNQSPNMIQNLSRGYLTGFARIGEQLSQPFANKDNYSGSDVNQTPIIRRFLQGPVRSQDEQQMQDFYQQKDIQNKIQDIKTGIKYGNIPMDAGMNEIKKLMNQQTQSTQPQSYFGAQSASATETSPVQDKLQEDQAKMRVFMNQKSEMLGDKIYVPTDSGASVIDLNPQPTGTGIKAFVDQNKKYDIARQVWDAPISQEAKNAAFQKLGVDPQDVRYDSLAHNGTDVSVQYIKSKSPDHQTLLNNLITGREESISGVQFASNAVISQLVNDGTLSKEEGAYLKKMKLVRENGKLKLKQTGRISTKVKKLPKLAVKKFKLKSYKGSPTVKSSPVPHIKVPNVSFNTQFTPGGVPQVPNFKTKIKFNV